MKDLVWKPVKAVRLEDLDEPTKARIATSITQQYRTWKSARRSQEDIWREIDRQVNQYDPMNTPLEAYDVGEQMKLPGGFGSKLKMTNTYSHREGIVSSMMQYLMANDYDFFDVVPLDPMDEEQTEAVKQYLLWLFDLMDFESAYVPFLRDVVQYGIGIASYEWCRETMPRWKRGYMQDPLTNQQVIVDYEATEVVYDAPRFTPLNIYFVVVDPTYTDLKTATLIYKKAVTTHDILANQAYKGLTYAIVEGAPEFGGNEDMALEQDRQETRRNYAYSGVTEYKGKKEVYEAWGDIVDQEIIYKNYVAEVLNGVLIRFEPNPYIFAHKPFVIARYTTETGRLYGHTPLASITGIQAGYDTIINQYIDNWAIENNRPLLVETNTVISQVKGQKPKLPPMSKDAIWMVRRKDGIGRLPSDGRTQQMDPVSILGFLSQQMERATGDTEMNSGGSPSPYMKTGVALTAANAGTTKLNMYAKTIEKESIVPVLDMTIDLLRQMNVPPMTMKRKDTSQQPIRFDPSFLMNRIQFSMRGASYNMTKQMQVSMLQQFLTSLASNPLTSQIINWIKAIKIIGDAMGIRRTDELIQPQAYEMMKQQQGFYPTFKQKIAGFFGAPQTPGSPQAPEDTQNVGLGQQLMAGTSQATGGSIPSVAGSGGGTSPYNISQA